MATTFDRCVYCFEPHADPGPCPICGYESGLVDQPAWVLSPGTILRGRYVLGQCREQRNTELVYLAWDLNTRRRLEIVEYFPRDLATRDCTAAPTVVCLPGQEEAIESGKQRFFEKAKLYYQCISRVEPLEMDFFVRNETCYYLRERT